MHDTALKFATQEIVLEDVFPYPPETVWHALTSGALMARWLMPPTGFEPVVGNRFTFSTTPAGEWDGTIRCEVVEVVPNARFAWRWCGGHEGNSGYGSLLDTLVTFTLTAVDGGTRLRLVHSGFITPRNDFAYQNMSNGWVKVVGALGSLAGEEG